jgi:hypothetical protein
MDESVDGAVGEPLVARYIALGLAIGRHIEGFVDSYYGPRAIADRVHAEPVRPPARLVNEARALLGDLAADHLLEPVRRRWLAGQTEGLATTAAKLAGVAIAYADEVEWCYGVRPRRVPEDVFASAHRRLEQALPGTGPLRERLIAWRESHAITPERLDAALHALAEDLRERTARAFGLPADEHVDFELVTDRPWSGFNYYLGGLRSRVAINTDLPVLSTSLAHLVAHEAYPGHHTEHCLKEVGLVRRRQQHEESIFLVGTPQCLLAEGLADLGEEVMLGRRPEAVVAAHLAPLGIRYDTEVVAAVAEASEDLAGLRGNVALMLHEDHVEPDEAIDYHARWGLQDRRRAAKGVEFLLDPTWRAYMTCYVEGLPLCRGFVAGDPARFRRLLTEQLLPSDLAATA